MKKNSIEKQKASKTISISGCAVINESRGASEYVQFMPDDPEGQMVRGWRHEGVAQLLGNGMFDFISRPRVRSASTLIKKVAHGRLSATKDGAVQLTLKIYKTEGIPMAETLMQEAEEAVTGVKF